MKVAVVGLGAIGITLAAALQQTGRHEVVGCARRPRTGLSVAVAGAPPMALDIPVVFEPGALAPVDWVVVAVKAHQNPGITPWLSRSVGRGPGVFAQAAYGRIPCLVRCPGKRSGRRPREVVQGEVSWVSP